MCSHVKIIAVGMMMILHQWVNKRGLMLNKS